MSEAPNNPPKPNVIFLAMDRLHVGYVGAYGNTWVHTPALDQLAADSLVLDRAITDSPRLDVIYRSLWLSLHALCPAGRDTQATHLARAFSAGGWRTALLADEQEVAEHPLATIFNERVWIRPQFDRDGPTSAIKISGEISDETGYPPRAQVAPSAEETDAAATFAAVGNWLEAAQPPYFLWVHSGTLARVWDAPLEFREQFRDEDDPPAVDWTNVPNQFLPEDSDPDEWLGITHSYAGQVSLVDQLLGSLLQMINNAGQAENTILVCLSLRGFPLGEHRRVGSCDDALYAELTHVPCIIRFPPASGIRGRVQHLVQPADITKTILDFCQLGEQPLTMSNPPASDNIVSRIGTGQSILPLARGEHTDGFDRACIIAPLDQQAFVTPKWSLRLSDLSNLNSAAAETVSNNPDLTHTPPKAELFVKPDDWFEINEVSDRCPGITEKMRTALNEFKLACQATEPATLAKLPDVLTMEFE